MTTAPDTELPRPSGVQVLWLLWFRPTAVETHVSTEVGAKAPVQSAELKSWMETETQRSDAPSEGDGGAGQQQSESCQESGELRLVSLWG